jgi:hypothetical protein
VGNAKRIELRRRIDGELIRVETHPSDTASLQLPLLLGDEVRWE